MGYIETDKPHHALSLYREMGKNDGYSGGHIFLPFLKSCAKLKDLNIGLGVHAEIARTRILKDDIYVGTALIDMYVKCGCNTKAQQVFDELSVQDVIAWNVLSSGYTENGHGQKALQCFEKMKDQGVSQNAITFVNTLRACASICDSDKGEEIHAEIERKGLLEDAFVSNTLVDMYARCGALTKAQQVFNKLRVQDVISWTSLMSGYAQLGDSENVFIIFDRMLGEGISPDKISFLVVLTACTRKGLLDKSWTYFEAMSQHYGIAPSIHHHACMLDVLSRSGHLHKALEIINESEFCSDLVIWRSILESCRKCGNLKMGLEAFEHAVNLDNKHPLAHMYASADVQPQKINMGYEV